MRKKNQFLKSSNYCLKGEKKMFEIEINESLKYLMWSKMDIKKDEYSNVQLSMVFFFLLLKDYFSTNFTHPILEKYPKNKTTHNSKYFF
jgi:hypothetical protein